MAAVVLSLSARRVLAGEVTGKGSKAESSQGRSICRSSGQSDNPSEAFPCGGRGQSYGYTVVRNGLKEMAPSPGIACNPNNGFGD